MMQKEVKQIKYPVIDRIQFVMHKLNLNEITPDQKREIGELVVSAFFSNPKHLYITKETIREKEGEVSVWVYPAHFVPVMDKIIFDFFINQTTPTKPTLPSLPTEPTLPVESTVETKPKKRKRVPVK